MRRRRTAKEQELEDRSSLLRAWRHWHQEQLREALAGVHRDVFERLTEHLKNLRSARALVEFISAQDWAAVDYDTRLIALHQINTAIIALCERSDLTPIDDPLPGQPESVFRIIKTMFLSFPPNPGKHTEDNSVIRGASNAEGCIEETRK